MSEEIKRVITIEDEATPALDNIKTSAEAAAGGLDEVSVNLESFKKAGDQFKDGLDDVSEGLDRIVPGSKNVIEGVTKLGKAFKALLKNPIGIALTAIVTVIGSLTLAIKKNDKAVAALSKAAKAFEPVLKVFSNLIEKIATGIAKVVEGIGNWVTKLFGLKTAADEAAAGMRDLNAASEANKKINSDIVDKNTEFNQSLNQLIANYDIFKIKLRSAPLKDKNKEWKEFIETNKTLISTLSGASGSFEKLLGGVKSTKDLPKAFDEISSSADTIRKEFEVAGNIVAVFNNHMETLKAGLKSIKSAETLEEVNKIFNDISESIGSTQTEYNQVVSEGIKIAGNNIFKWKEYLSGVLNDSIVTYDKLFSEYESSAGEVGEMIVEALAKSIDLSEVGRKIAESWGEFKVKLPDIEIEDLDIDSVFEEFKYTLEEKTSKLLEETPIKNPLEALFEISSEQLNNLDQYSNAYFEKAKEVENVGWQIEEARLEREGYTNEQIEALRREHNKRLENIDKEQISATLSNIGVYSDAISSLGSGLISIIEATAEEGEDSFEKTKGLQVAVATIDTLSGVMGAWTSALNSGIPTPYSYILGGIQSAAVLATGVANVAKIKNTKIGGGGSVSSATPSTPANAYNPTYTANVTGQSDIDQLQKTIESGTSNAVKDQKVYITETDLEASRNNRKVKVEESTW